MEYKSGTHIQEVNEVLEFVKSDKLLSGGQLPEGIDAVVVDELDQIPTEEDYEKYDDERPLWRDILGKEASKFFCLESDAEKSYDPYRSDFLSKLVDKLTKRYKEFFPEQYNQRILDLDIPGILSYIVHCRIVMGKQHRFFETLFRIFKSGGYPCGWDGCYPQGRLIVFYPKKPVFH